MKKAAWIFLIMVFLGSCKKYENSHLPQKGTYILKGDQAKFYVNGLQEGAGTVLVLVSGGYSVSYDAIPLTDTIYKSLWTGDTLRIAAHSHTSIWFSNGVTQKYLVDSSGNPQASIVLQ